MRHAREEGWPAPVRAQARQGQPRLLAGSAKGARAAPRPRPPRHPERPARSFLHDVTPTTGTGTYESGVEGARFAASFVTSGGLRSCVVEIRRHIGAKCRPHQGSMVRGLRACPTSWVFTQAGTLQIAAI